LTAAETNLVDDSADDGRARGASTEMRGSRGGSEGWDDDVGVTAG